MATRGRPKGAKSFVNVEMETLNKYFDEHAQVDTNKKLLKG